MSIYSYIYYIIYNYIYYLQIYKFFGFFSILGCHDILKIVSYSVKYAPDYLFYI